MWLNMPRPNLTVAKMVIQEHVRVRGDYTQQFTCSASKHLLAGLSAMTQHKTLMHVQMMPRWRSGLPVPAELQPEQLAWQTQTWHW